MKIAFVCNQNLARSKVLAAFFSQLLKGHNFLSFGVIAVEGKQNPVVINLIFKKWGLPSTKQPAQNVVYHLGELLSCDIVFTVSNFIYSYVGDLGFKGKLINLELSALNLGVTLTDPQLISQRRCELELAKYLKVTYSEFMAQGFLRKLKFSAIIPRNERSFYDTLTQIKLDKSVKTYLYADLIAPIKFPPGEYPKKVVNYRFDPQNCLIESDFSGTYGETQILIPTHPVSNPHEVYLNEIWTTYLASIDSENLVLITPPINSFGGVVPESFLSALSAKSIRILD